MADISDPKWTEEDNLNTAPPPDGLPPGSPPTALYGVIRSERAAIKRKHNRESPTKTSTGTGAAYVLTYEVGPAATIKGDTYSFIAHAANTGAATLKVNAQAARSIINNDGTALAAGHIQANQIVEVAFDGTSFRLLTPVTNNLKLTGTLTGSGAGLANLNASNLTSGTIANARISGAYDGITTLGMSGLLTVRSTGEAIRLIAPDDAGDPFISFHRTVAGTATRQGYIQHTDGTATTNGLLLRNDTSAGYLVLNNAGELRYNNLLVWHAGKMGSGSGLDADKVDGVELAGLVQTSRSVIAGNGLSGGGTLAADRTVALGTPGTITMATTNSVTATSHTHDLSITAANLNTIYGYTPANNAIQVVAGNGLSGGGTLAASRTVTLGTPSTITQASTNSVTATSHTHFLGFTAAEVDANTADTATNYVLGTYVLAYNQPSGPARNATSAVYLTAGSTYHFNLASGTLCAGTWRGRGHAFGDRGMVLMQRVA